MFTQYSLCQYINSKPDSMTNDQRATLGATLSLGLRVFCVGNSCFLRRWLVFVFFATVLVGGVFATVAGVFCDGPGGRVCFLQRLAMFFASVGCVFCVGGVFCDGNPCFLRRLAGSPSRWSFLSATHVFCEGRRKSCFLRRFLLLCGSSHSSSISSSRRKFK